MALLSIKMGSALRGRRNQNREIEISRGHRRANNQLPSTSAIRRPLLAWAFPTLRRGIVLNPLGATELPARPGSEKVVIILSLRNVMVISMLVRLARA